MRIPFDQDADEDDVQWLKIHGYDAILFAEQDYPADSKLTWPAKDIDVVREIAQGNGRDGRPEDGGDYAQRLPRKC